MPPRRTPSPPIHTFCVVKVGFAPAQALNPGPWTLDPETDSKKKHNTINILKLQHIVILKLTVPCTNRFHASRRRCRGSRPWQKLGKTQPWRGPSPKVQPMEPIWRQAHNRSRASFFDIFSFVILFNSILFIYLFFHCRFFSPFSYLVVYIPSH